MGGLDQTLVPRARIIELTPEGKQSLGTAAVRTGWEEPLRFTCPMNNPVVFFGEDFGVRRHVKRLRVSCCQSATQPRQLVKSSNLSYATKVQIAGGCGVCLVRKIFH